MSQLITSISQISSLYEHYIFDISGVLTNGAVVFDGAIKCLQSLEEQGKQVIMLSNAPRLPKYTGKKLAEHGINTANLVTSGSFLLHDFKNPKVFKGLSGKCYKMGDDVNDLWDQPETQFNFVNDLSAADFFVANKYFDDISKFDAYLPQLKQALELNLPCVCANPDIIVYYGDNLRYPQGYIADKYEQMGGKVYYYGKPYKSIYNHIAELFTIELGKTLMIGDNIFTDIKGAKSFGIDSLLITSGNHRNDDIDQLCMRHKLHPQYKMEQLQP